MNSKKLLILMALGSLLLTGCFATTRGGARGTGIDQQPMYGGIDRNANAQLKTGDEQFISGVTKEFGSRESASDRFVEQGIRYYYQNNFSMAMKRFNQAWLLNPKNPDSFWGFAIVYHDEGKDCEAKKMIDSALELKLSKPIALADAGTMYTLCAASDKSLDQSTKKQYFTKSEELYKTADTAAPNNDYIHGMWAMACYWREDYARSWEMVAKARRYGFVFPGQFINQLRQKMPEPKSSS